MPTQAEIKTSVASRDGTQIAYWTSGAGPPLVLVHGAPADHTRWRPLLPYLEPYVTVHALDRRGRGDSGDAPEYRLEREYEECRSPDSERPQAHPLRGLAGPGPFYLRPPGGGCDANEQTVGRG